MSDEPMTATEVKKREAESAKEWNAVQAKWVEPLVDALIRAAKQGKITPAQPGN